MDHSDSVSVVGIAVAAIAFLSLVAVVSSYPRSVTGQVTAIGESYFPTDTTTVYLKTLNGSEQGLSITATGINLPVKIGSTYKITTTWFNSLVSIAEIA